jgi:hypothetical protein
MGGRKNRRFRSEDTICPLPAPQTAKEIKTLLAQTMVEVRSGRIEPKIASVLGYLSTAFIKAIEISEIEERIKVLEESLHESQYDRFTQREVFRR